MQIRCIPDPEDGVSVTRPETRSDPAAFLKHLNIESGPELMRVADVADLLCVCPQTVYHLIQSGELAAVEIGRGAKRVFRHGPAEYLASRIV